MTYRNIDMRETIEFDPKRICQGIAFYLFERGATSLDLDSFAYLFTKLDVAKTSATIERKTWQNYSDFHRFKWLLTRANTIFTIKDGLATLREIESI